MYFIALYNQLWSRIEIRKSSSARDPYKDDTSQDIALAFTDTENCFRRTSKNLISSDIFIKRDLFMKHDSHMGPYLGNNLICIQPHNFLCFSFSKTNFVCAFVMTVIETKHIHGWD